MPVFHVITRSFGDLISKLPCHICFQVPIIIPPPSTSCLVYTVNNFYFHINKQIIFLLFEHKPVLLSLTRLELQTPIKGVRVVTGKLGQEPFGNKQKHFESVIAEKSVGRCSCSMINQTPMGHVWHGYKEDRK